MASPDVGEVVYFEEDGRERVVTGRCGRCERTNTFIFSPGWVGCVVSPSGVMHIGVEYGMTACGIDATGPDWWWRL